MTTLQSQPTHYLIQEKHLSLDNRFIITDELGTIHYKVNATFFAMGDKFLLSDANGNELMKIRQDKFRLHLTYKIFSIYCGTTDREIASIKRTGAMWQHKLEISSLDGEYLMQKKGGASSNEFVLTKNDDVIAVVTKDSSPTKSLFWVDITDSSEQNHALILASVIILSAAQRLPGNPMAKPSVNETKNDE